MNLSKEQLKELEELGGLMFTPSECAITLEVNYDELKCELEKPGNEIYNAYMRGVLTTEYHLRKVLLRDAKNGSQPAQDSYMKYYKKLMLEMV